MKLRTQATLVILAAAAVYLIAEGTGFPVLPSRALEGKQAAGFYLVPTHQLIRPWGEQATFPGRPVDMAFNSDKSILAILNTRSVLLRDGATGAEFHEIKARATSYAGVAFRPGDRELWASEATRNGPDSLLVAAIGEDGKPGKIDHIELKGHPVPSGLVFSQDGKTAYVAFSRNNSLAIFDVDSRRLREEVPVGIAPFGVALSRASGKIFVTNRGGRRPRPGDVTAPSSTTNVVTDAVTGSATSGTFTIFDPETRKTRDIDVGLAPSAVIVSPDQRTIAVTNSHSDSVSLFDIGPQGELLPRDDVHIPSYPDSTLGSQPDAAVFEPEGKRLYVSCGGNNAIAVLTRSGKKWTVEGAIPAGWFPTAVAIGKDGSLRVLNVKGVGNTANGKGQFNTHSYEGSLLTIPAPESAQIAAGTREVRAANSPVFEPNGGVANLPSLGVKYVFLIIKENRTYDQVFGDMGKGNGDPKLTFYGREITPNHHALAEQFVLLDNFYASGSISFDGHQWLMQAFVSDYVERAFAASPRGYAWNMSDSLVVPPTGFFWQSAARPLNVRIYGEFQLPAKYDTTTQSATDMDEVGLESWSYYWKRYKEGTWRNAVGAKSGVPALQKYCSRSFPNSALMIPDQIRAEEYLREFGEHEKSGVLPNLNIITLNNDHTAGKRPGMPIPRAMVADNDLALGRIVERISKSRFWPNSLTLVVEDDAQDGVDHVDGRRTVALAIGPHIRRGAVDSNYYSHTSMIRTIQDIFQISPRSKFLINARAMNSVFTPQADLRPYEHIVPQQQLDEMNPELKGLNGLPLWAARQSMAMNWRHVDDIDEDALNKILWWDAKGYGVPYPKLRD
jgi:YVTN family beta-propeller protein